MSLDISSSHSMSWHPVATSTKIEKTDQLLRKELHSFDSFKHTLTKDLECSVYGNAGDATLQGYAAPPRDPLSPLLVQWD